MTGSDERAAIVLAAGAGTRMKSDLPKVLHPIGARPMIEHVLETARRAGMARIVVVVGHGREKVKEVLGDRGLSFAVQAEQLGTGHAVETAAPALEGFEGRVAVLCGDVPLLRATTIEALAGVHERGGYAATVLTFRPDEPRGYGRVFRDGRGDVIRIVEQRDLSPTEEPPGEVNSGTYVFEWRIVRPLLHELDTDNNQGEYYLTDVVSLLRERGHRVGGYETDDPIEVAGVNTVEQLRTLDEEFRRRSAGAP